jgi:hypothetical protein
VILAVVPIGLGLCGAGLLLYAAFILIKESRFALAAVNEEMDFTWKRGKEYGPPYLVQKGIKRTMWFGGVKYGRIGMRYPVSEKKNAGQKTVRRFSVSSVGEYISRIR